MSALNSKKYLQNFRNLLLKKRERVSNIEITTGNYDEKGDLIEDSIPTITTDFCEIGIYNEIIYFTFVLHSNTYDERLFNLLKDFSNAQIYGFKDFKTTFYPQTNFNFETLEKNIKKEKYFQINFNYNFKNLTQEDLYKEYVKIRNIFIKNKIRIINQLQINLVKEKKENRCKEAIKER